jgi:hypothetical protein
LEGLAENLEVVRAHERQDESAVEAAADPADSSFQVFAPEDPALATPHTAEPVPTFVSALERYVGFVH